MSGGLRSAAAADVTDGQLGGAAAREAAIGDLESRARRLHHQVNVHIASFQPIGKPADISVAMGLKAPKGEVIDTPLGVLLFAPSRKPSPEVVQGWYERIAEADQLRRESSALSVWVDEEPGTTVGGPKVVEHLDTLAAQGMLDPHEIDVADRLRAFWANHADAESGVWTDGGGIDPLLAEEPRHRALLEGLDDDTLLRTVRHAVAHPPAPMPVLCTPEKIAGRLQRLQHECARRGLPVA